MPGFFERNRYTFLLATLLLVILITPVVVDYLGLNIIVNIALSLMVISAVHAITQKKKTVIISVILAALSISGIWWSYISHESTANLVHNLIDLVFISFVVFHIFTAIFKAKHVNRNVIHGAIVIYLLIGFFWSYIYTLVEHLHPGSFASSGKALLSGYQPFLYFSFVTLTTTGFGDITPVTDLARSLTILEAIIGQFYLIINVSWLVGLYVAHTRDERRG